MSRKTPKYLFPFSLDGEAYSSADDLDRMTVIDNQLARLSQIAGDGTLSGWTISDATGLDIEVSAGSGFIESVFHRTLSIKAETVANNIQTSVYMKSTMLGTNEGFALEVESPFSNGDSATFVDVTPPATPSNFQAAAPSYDYVTLTWTANPEIDFDHYEIEKSLNNILFVPLVELLPTVVYTDEDVIGSTTYYYRLIAVDTSGNPSVAATASVATMVDTHIPGEITNLRLYPGNGSISIVFDPSPSADVAEYLVTVDSLNPNGTILANIQTLTSIGLSETSVVSGLTNNIRHRVTVVANNTIGNMNTGVSSETVPVFVSAPADVTSLTATPIAHGVTLSWTASASASGSAIGQKSTYVLIVYKDGVASAPIDLGLVTTKTLTSYNAAAAIGTGATVFFQDDFPYLFKITARDIFGNESGGVFSKSTTLDTTAPNSPRYITALPLDTEAIVTWKHSSSKDVVGYNIAVDVGLGFGADTELAYIEGYLLTGLPNETLCTVRLRARDDVGNLSAAITTEVTPTIDVTPPAHPLFVQLNAQDGFVSMSWKQSPETDLDHYVVKRQLVSNPLSDPANIALTVLSTTLFNVGTNTNMVDVGLVNGNVYAYSVQAIDERGNESPFTSSKLVSPTAGLNITDLTNFRLTEPTSLTAVFNAGSIELDWVHPGTSGVTNFNIYRSQSLYSNYQLIASVDGLEREYLDSGLVNGETYYYLVTAVRDNAELLLETGGIQPANTILLGTVTASGGSITEITNSQRLIQDIQGTIEDETLSRLVTHRHLVAPLNGTAVTAVRSIAMIDASELALSDAYTLSDEARLYYRSILRDEATGLETVYEAGTTFVVHPAVVVYNVPFVGDFQLLVSGERPTVEFSLDEDKNAMVFSEPISGTVTINGLGLTFYVPARIDLGYRGFDVSVSTGEALPLVDEPLQTLRFLSTVSDDAVVTVTVEPAVPDFGSQQGARQVSLSPDIVLSDFTPSTTMTYVSDTGTFTSTDTVFVLVDGERTSLDHYVDFEAKSIVFALPLDPEAVVSLEIRGKEEVTSTLPARRVGQVDASQFTTGEFLKPQMPVLSHEGRVQERAYPVFQDLATDNKYVYSGIDGLMGTARTPYAAFQLNDGNMMIGTSAGVLKTSVIPTLIVGENDTVTMDPGTIPQSPVLFAENDDIVGATLTARNASGRVSGSMLLKDVDQSLFALATVTMTVLSPSVAMLDDGRILITGGKIITTSGTTDSKQAFVYDPIGPTTTRVADMDVPRIDHACALLPNGRVLISGGMDMTSLTCVAFAFDTSVYPDGLAHLRVLKSCELYDSFTEAFTAAADMDQARYNHSLDVIDPNDPLSEVLVAGGSYLTSTGNWRILKLFDAGPLSAAIYVQCNQDTWTLHQTASSERYDVAGNTWTDTLGSMLNPMEIITSSADNGKVVVNGKKVRELYDSVTDEWSASNDAPEDLSVFSGLAAIDGPVKYFFRDSQGYIFAVTRNAIFASSDEGLNFVATKGLESTGVVHRIAEDAAGNLYAATDLGVYLVEVARHDELEWFQGGLIGAGTTETFDLQAVGANMLAATEIGIFSTPDGTTWTPLLEVDDVYNIELIGTLILFANAGKKLYKSINSGAAWTLVGSYDFIDPSAIMVARSPLDLFFGSSAGLYYSPDGILFELLDFDLNRNPSKNNVQMVALLGGDVVVGYDNVMYSIDSAYGTYSLAEFTGIVPTIRVNGVEVRNGFRYDTKRHEVVFERKRLAKDEVSASSNYSLFKLDGGGWYDQNPNGPVRVFVNKVEQADGAYLTDARLGAFSFTEPLSKTDIMTTSIAGTTLRNEGELFHRELEDRMSMEKGLPLSLSHEHEASLLQFGIAVEHNFLEIATPRDPENDCIEGAPVERPLNALLQNADFIILGRTDFDRFNSTIDYLTESSQPEIGTAALVPLSAIEIDTDALWIGTESGIFVLDPTSAFEVSETILVGVENNPVRAMISFLGATYAATKHGVYKLYMDPTLVIERNVGAGLPASTFSIAVVANNLVVGTEDGIYYAEPGLENEYDTWFRASYSSIGGEELFYGGDCRAMFSEKGVAYAAIGGTLFRSNDGKAWTMIYEFEDEDVFVTSIIGFAERILVGTNLGVYNDDGTARSNEPGFRIELIEATEPASMLHINDMFATSEAMYVACESSSIYMLQSEAWTSNPISGVESVHQVIMTVGGSLVAISNNVVFVE